MLVVSAAQQHKRRSRLRQFFHHQRGRDLQFRVGDLFLQGGDAIRQGLEVGQLRKPKIRQLLLFRRRSLGGVFVDEGQNFRRRRGPSAGFAARICASQSACPLAAPAVIFGQTLLGLRQFGVQHPELRLHVGGWQIEHRRRVPPDGSAVVADSLLGHIVEESEQRIEILLRERIVLVVVAAGAAQRLPQPHRRGGLDAVGAVLGEELFRDHAALFVDHGVAVKPGGDPLFERRVRQQVAGNLLDGELVERQVAVEGRDDPVAPRVHLAVAVHLIAVRVRKPPGVEPVEGHPLAIVGRLQQPGDDLFVRVRRRVRQESVDLGRRRRQPRQVERHAADQGGPVCLRRRRQALLFQLRQDEAIDRIARPRRQLHVRQLRAHRRQIRPVRLVFGARGDPALQGFLLAGRQLALGIRRRHERVGIRRQDAFDQRAVRGIAGPNGSGLNCRLALIDPQITVAVPSVRPVAGEAVLRKDGPDVAVERQNRGQHPPPAQGCLPPQGCTRW